MSRPVTSEMIARAGAALAEGGWQYTPRQLYYATCAAAESPPQARGRGELAAGVLLGLVALILLPIHPAALAVGAIAVLVFAAGLVARLTQRPPAGRVLPVSWAEFRALLASEAPPRGLVETTSSMEAEVARAAVRADGSGSLCPVTVVCDTEENATAVTLNLGRERLGPLRVVVGDDPSLDAALERAIVVALHDASPRGCAVPLALRDAGARVVDAGLRPAWVDGNDVQVQEGAPARLPRDLTAALGEGEIDWLRSGRRVELAVLPPQRLLRLISAGVEHARADAAQHGTPTSAGSLAAPLAALP